MSKKENNASHSTPKSRPHRGSRLVRADLKAYLDGELSGLRRWLVQWHLVRCAECREEITWLQRLGKNMQNLEEAQPRPQLRTRIMASLPDAPPPAPRFAQPTFTVQPSLFQRNGLRLALSVSLVVLTLGGVFALTHMHSSSNSPQPSANIAEVKPHPIAPTVTADVPTKPAPVIAKTVDPFREPDQTSKEATQIANEWAKNQAAQAGKQQQEDWKRMLASARFGKNESKTAPTEAVCVSLAVPDVSVARQNLQTWTKRVGGTMLLAKNEREISMAMGGELVLMRVPADKGNSMLGQLKKIGEVAGLKTMPLLEKPDSGKMQPTRMSTRDPEENPSAAIPPGNVKAEGSTRPDGNSKSEGSMRPQSHLNMSLIPMQDDHASVGASVTITVLLKPVNRSVQ